MRVSKILPLIALANGHTGGFKGLCSVRKHSRRLFGYYRKQATFSQFQQNQSIFELLIDDDHLIGKHSVGHLCLKKYTTGEDCEVDYGELGNFTTAEPWSHISLSDFPDLGRRPAVVPASPESIGTYFSLLNRNIDFKSPVVFSHKNVTKSIEGRISAKKSQNNHIYQIVRISRMQKLLYMHMAGHPHPVVSIVTQSQLANQEVSSIKPSSTLTPSRLAKL